MIAKNKPNLAQGAIVTVTGFDNLTPDHLERTTDGNPTISSGTGTKNNVNGTIGTIIFDLGEGNENKRVDVAGLFGLWASTGNAQVYIDGSNVSNFSTGDSSTILGTRIAATSAGDVTEVKRDCQVMRTYGRYIRFRFLTSTTANGNMKGYDVTIEEA